MSIPTTPAEFLAKIPQTTQDPCTALSNALLAYPQLVYEFFKWAIETDGSKFTQAFQNEIFSVGDYKASAASNLDTGTSASRWLYCNGDQKSETDFPALAALLGTGGSSIFGAASVGNFKLPDFRNKFFLPVGTTHALAATGGVETVTLTIGEVPAHTHDVQIPGDDATDTANTLTIQGQTGVNMQTFTTDTKGGGGSHDNMPPYVVGGYIYIKT